MTENRTSVGIITFHHGINYGANLQAYALCEYLNTHGFNAQVIDYRPRLPLARRRRWLHALLKMHPYNLIRMLKESRFHAFRSKYVPLSSVTYNSGAAITANPPVFDAYICGSDQIWNTSILNDHIDPVFFLSFAPPDDLKIAYAPSFGGERPPHSDIPKLKTLLTEMDHISVREADGADLVAELIGTKPQVTVDPTLLLSAYDKVLPAKSKGRKDYVFFYRLQFAERTERIAELTAETLGKRLLTASVPWTSRDIGHLAFPGPEGWLGLIRDASCVITNSFHATVFSILFKKKFVVAPLTDDMAGRNNRILTLLASLGLSDRMISGDNEEALRVILSRDISWKEVDERLSMLRADSEEYLMRALARM